MPDEPAPRDRDAAVSAPEAAPLHEPAHDPTGLELARAVAAEIRRAPHTTRGAPGRRPHSGGAASSGAHPDDRDPVQLASAVGRLVNENGWSTEVSVHTVLGRWALIVGPEVARHSDPESYADGIVSVAADSTAWATQLRLLAPTLVARLNAELGDGTVIRVQVRGPNGPSWRRGRWSARDGRGPRDTYG